MTNFRPFIFIAMWIVSVYPASGQNDVRFEHITVDNGLSQSSVTSMVQDQFGYLWIATLDGLNRYDGSTFRVYRNSKRDKYSMPANQLSNLYLDLQQSLWLSYSGGISQFNQLTESFTNYPIVLPGSSESDYDVHDFDPLSDSIILLSTNRGVLELNCKTKGIRQSQDFKFFDGQNISNVYLTNSGSWVMTNRQAWLKKPGAAEWKKIWEDDLSLATLYAPDDQHFYFQTRDQLVNYNPSTGQSKLLFSFSSDEDFDPNRFGMMKLMNGELWVVRSVIHVFDATDTWQRTLQHDPTNPFSLSGSHLSVVFETRDGVVWVGTNGLGLNKYNPSLSIFRYLAQFHGAALSLSSNYVTSVFTRDDKQILVGTLNGIDIVDLQRNRSRHIPVMSSSGKGAQVYKFFEGPGTTVGLATNKGMMLLHQDKIRRIGIPVLDDPEISIYDVIRQGAQTYVLSTSKGLLQWDTNTNMVKTISSLGSMVLLEVNGEYWVEANERISTIRASDHQIIKTFAQISGDSTSSPAASIKCFFRDSNRNIWIGSWGGGLSLYDSVHQHFRHFGEREGLPNAVVYGILEDKSGNLWLSTNEGLCVFDPKLQHSIRNFSKLDGLQGNEFNTRAYFQSPSGMMYFGGINGLTFFDPEKALQIPSFIPQSVITAFYINNKEVGNSPVIAGVDPTIELEWIERNFGFEIAGLGFTFPSGIQYQYKLENFDRDWNFIGRENRIMFTNISPGRYTLRVKSGNTFGDWEEEGLAIVILVKGPIWRSNWFIFSMISLVVGLAYLGYEQRIRFLRSRAIYLQAQVLDRTREIQKQQEEIAAQNEELVAQAEMLEQRNQELEKIKDSLERRVERRTQKLKNLNDELIEQNSQLEQFAFITAHNIRGPVARIKGLINFILPAKPDDVIEHLKTSVRNLDEVISDLNTVLNIRQGIHKSIEPVQVKEQLMHTLQTLSTDIAAVDAHVDINDFAEVTIPGMKPYFQSIFYNLIHNALKYAKHGYVRPTIKCYTMLDQERIIMVVEDNGIGIDMRYAKGKIFKLYQRFHSDTFGKGFGLFLVKTQVEAMSGKISVESELNVGTKFTIEFPCSPEVN
ncbi:MAG: hypothetical protein JNM57_15135 [Cyclobacteriaceae bacterium]|nr:hypothetical protein [Cyclobacteriaceae bacterium]